MAQQIGNEAKTLGVSQVFAPLADLARELRYGRVEETYGEDGYLAGEMAMSYVKGVQGTNVSATIKVRSEYSGSSISGLLPIIEHSSSTFPCLFPSVLPLLLPCYVENATLTPCLALRCLLSA